MTQHETQSRRLKRIRELAGLSQLTAASLTQIDRTTYNMIERGHIAPKREQVAAIEKVCLEVVQTHAKLMKRLVSGQSNSPEDLMRRLPTGHNRRDEDIVIVSPREACR